MKASQRKAVYGVVAAATFVAIAFGLVTEDQVGAIVASVTAAVAGVANILAYLNTHPE